MGLIPLKEYAKLMDVPYSTARHWAVTGRIKGVVRKGNKIFVPDSEVKRVKVKVVMAGQKINPDDPTEIIVRLTGEPEKDYLVLSKAKNIPAVSAYILCGQEVIDAVIQALFGANKEIIKEEV